MSKKVRQTATVTVTFITHDMAITRASLTRMIGHSPNVGVVYNKPIAKYEQLIVFQADVKYTAMGANRDDINRRIKNHAVAEAIIVEPRARIEKQPV